MFAHYLLVDQEIAFLHFLSVGERETAREREREREIVSLLVCVCVCVCVYLVSE